MRLAPFEAADVEALHAISNGQPGELGRPRVGAYDADALIWRYMPAGPFADADGARARTSAASPQAPDGLCLTRRATCAPASRSAP